MTGISAGSGSATFYNTDKNTSYIELTVTNGDTASATITGDSPNYTLNLVLPKGDKGAKGDKVMQEQKVQMVLLLHLQ